MECHLPDILGVACAKCYQCHRHGFLGHVGEVALGAAAMGGLLYICVYTVAFGFSVGSQILIARRNGEGNFHAIGPVMWQGTAFSLGMGVALLAILLVCAEPLIRLLITSDTIFLCYIRVFYMAYLGISFCLCQCHVPCALYRYNQDKGTDHECCRHGLGECIPRLCDDIRKVWIP